MASCCGLLLGLLAFVSLCSFALAEGSGCSANDDYLKNKRVNNLLNSILAQFPSSVLNGSYNFTDNSTSDEIDPEILEQYYLLKNSTENLEPLPEVGHEGSCYDGDFYAKPVSTFVGSMMPAASLPSTDGQGQVLAVYTAEINFTLSSQLTDVYRADLLLYQEPTLTSPKHIPRDYQQHVQITALVQGSEGLERQIVDSKQIDTFADGHQVFDVTKAVNQWLDSNIEDLVTLEVVVLCFSSPHCAETDGDGRGPAKVSFLYATSNSSKAPRLIVVSSNPLEQTSRIAKRSANKREYCEGANQLCCLRNLTINFKKDLRLSLVAYPPDFEANYCSGICPGISDTEVQDNNHRYTFLSRLGNNHPALTLEPCCAGSRYESESVVMKTFNEQTGKFSTKIVKLQQVRVTACRCG